MSFTFRKYGTFTGPGVDIEYRDNDDFSLDPFEGYFNLDDVAMLLINTTSSPEDYAYLKLDGSNTSKVTLGRSSGPLSIFNAQANVSSFSGEVYSNGGGHRLSAKKNFDIPHPSKPGWRLRHTCLEGPENAVYVRGKLEGNNYIELPEYWKNLVDIETVTVSLTSIGSYQELFYEIVDWGTKIKVLNNAGGHINCSYVIYGERKDGEKLIVEYKGDNPGDYPGNNDEYSVVGWNYDIRS